MPTPHRKARIAAAPVLPKTEYMKRFSIALMFLLLSVIWTKADGSPGESSADLRECRMLAADEMWRMSWDRRWPPRFYNPRFMPPYYLNRRPFWYDFPNSIERENALVDFCMHSKGYRLETLPY